LVKLTLKDEDPGETCGGIMPAMTALEKLALRTVTFMPKRIPFPLR